MTIFDRHIAKSGIEEMPLLAGQAAALPLTIATMAISIGTQIESLLQKGQWAQAQTLIQKQLDKQPADHWLWSRLSGGKYENRNYEEALAAAEAALKIVPDCPLALWSKAGALDMLARQPRR